MQLVNMNCASRVKKQNNSSIHSTRNVRIEINIHEHWVYFHTIVMNSAKSYSTSRTKIYLSVVNVDLIRLHPFK